MLKQNVRTYKEYLKLYINTTLREDQGKLDITQNHKSTLEYKYESKLQTKCIKVLRTPVKDIEI